MGFELKRFTVKFNDDYSVISGLELGDFYCQKTFPDSPMMFVTFFGRHGMGITFNYNPTNKRFIYGYVGVNGYIENAVGADTETFTLEPANNSNNPPSQLTGGFFMSKCILQVVAFG